MEIKETAELNSIFLMTILTLQDFIYSKSKVISILGMRFLQKNNCIINFSDSIVKINGGEYKINLQNKISNDF